MGRDYIAHSGETVLNVDARRDYAPLREYTVAGIVSCSDRSEIMLQLSSAAFVAIFRSRQGSQSQRDCNGSSNDIPSIDHAVYRSPVALG